MCMFSLYYMQYIKWSFEKLLSLLTYEHFDNFSLLLGVKGGGRFPF